MITNSTLARFGALLLVCWGSLLPAQCVINLANNPSFMDANGAPTVQDYYTFGAGTLSPTTDVTDGTGASLVPPATGNAFVAQSINSNIIAGNTYTFSVSVKGDLSGGGYVNIGMDYRDANGSSTGFDFDQESITPDATDMMTFSITRLAPLADPANGRPNDAARVQIFVEVGTPAQITVDSFMLVDVTPVDPAQPCANSLIAGGTFASDGEGFGTDDPAVSFSPDEGVDCSGALRIDGGATSGYYGLNAADGDLVELTFQAKAIADGGFPGGKLIFFNSDYSANFGSAVTEIQGPDFVTYRVVAEATDPSIATFAVELVGSADADIVFDNICALAFTPEPVVPVPGNLVVNGDFENGTTPFSATTFNQKHTQDPATGLGAQMFNRGAYGFGATPNISIVGGQEHTIMVDAKRIGSVQYAKVNYFLYDATGTQIGGRIDNSLTFNGEDFTANTITFTPPMNAAEIRIEYESDDGGQNGYTVLDNLSLVNNVLLPAQLTSFTGQAQGKQNILNWETATEDNTDRFEVERSLTGASGWTTVATRVAAGNSTRAQTYVAVDEQPLVSAYYRLRTVDVDGTTELSDVIRIARAEAAAVSAYPNPFGGTLFVESQLEAGGEYLILNSLGRVVQRGNLPAGNQRTELSTDELPAGQYFIRIGDRVISVVK